MEGAVSPYYAGLNLAMIAACTLMPWTFGDAACTCLSIIALYLVACLLHRGTAFDPSIFFNNVYFLVIVGIICVTTCYFTARRRFNEFRLCATRSRCETRSWRSLTTVWPSWTA
jgi:hypothetical protein